MLADCARKGASGGPFHSQSEDHRHGETRSCGREAARAQGRAKACGTQKQKESAPHPQPLPTTRKARGGRGNGAVAHRQAKPARQGLHLHARVDCLGQGPLGKQRRQPARHCARIQNKAGDLAALRRAVALEAARDGAARPDARHAPAARNRAARRRSRGRRVRSRQRRRAGVARRARRPPRARAQCANRRA